MIDAKEIIQNNGVEIPSTAYAVHQWALDAWELQTHPPYMRFTIYRGSCGRRSEYDGYILPEGEVYDGMVASAYVHGWLNGRDSKK